MNHSTVRTKFSAAVFGLLFWLIFVSTGQTQNGGTWQTRAPMPVSRQKLATGVLNGKVYVIGGYDGNGNSTATVQVYNPTTDTWASAHSIPYAVNHNAAAVAGGNLYSFGAGAGEVFVYNPNNNSWGARASSHYVHSQTAAVGVISNNIYAAGGTGTPSQRELEVYDPVANTWTIKAPMSVPQSHRWRRDRREILCRRWTNRTQFTTNRRLGGLQSTDQHLVHSCTDANCPRRYRGRGGE
jgi:hypothetical protein